MESKLLFTAPIIDAIIPSGVVGKPSINGAFIFNTMKLIKLTQGKSVQVDDTDFDWLNQWKWHTIKDSKTYYAARSEKVNGKYKRIWMHRFILNTPVFLFGDHKDHNGLNCQRYNLRNCTLKQNQANRIARGKSQYKGVCLSNNIITASIYINKKNVHLGIFKTEEQAACAYDNAAKEYYGEFANLNFKY